MKQRQILQGSMVQEKKVQEQQENLKGAWSMKKGYRGARVKILKGAWQVVKEGAKTPAERASNKASFGQ